MKTNKILAAALAGLCAVSTMGVSAFAADEKIETSGAKSYKVSAAFQAPTIDVSVPEEVAAIINPYMIAVKLSDTVSYEAEGIASPKYTITNNSKEVGINVKATYSAEGLDGVVASEDAAVKTDAANNKDKKKLAYVTLNAESPLDVTKSDTTASAADAVNTLEFAADTATVKEKTDVLMRLNVAADGKTDNAGKFWIGGAVIEEPAEKWAASDKLSINVVLDINPFNTGATGGSGGGNNSITLDTSAATLDGVTINAAAATGTVTIDMGDTGEASFTALKDAGGNTYKKTGTYIVEEKTNDDSVGVTIAANGKVTFAGTGTDGTYTVVLTFKDTVNNKSQDITFTVTEENN